MAGFKATIQSEFRYFLSSLYSNILELFFTICLFLCSGLVALLIFPKQRANYNNFIERYPYTGETINSTQVGIFIILIPCLIILSVAIAFPRKSDLFLAYLSFIETLAVTLLITEVLKVTVARPRPNYFSYCGYDASTQQCHGPDKYKRDAKLSFPSGHSSNSFSSATWIVLWLTHFFPQTQIWWILLKLIPIGLAAYVAATRITDYMHHVSDVVAGTLIGICVGTFIFMSQQSRIFLSSDHQDDEIPLNPSESIE